MGFGKRQEALLEGYAKELRAVKPVVNAWWAQLVAQERTRQPNDKAVADALRTRWPEGPSVHPRVVAIIRKYYLAFEALNETLHAELAKTSNENVDFVPRSATDEPTEEPEQPISPSVMLTEGLSTEENRDLLPIPAKYAHWPIGMGEHEWRSSSPS